MSKEADIQNGKNAKIKVVNPATEEVIGTFDSMNSDQVKEIVNYSREEFELWKKKDVTDRTEYIKNLGKVLKKNKQDCAKIITQEMGKPIKQSLAEIEKCAWVCDYYSQNAQVFLRDQIVPTEFYKSYVSFEPLGVIASIMPWNFPFWQVFRFCVPTVIAGNTTVLKHSSKTIGTSLKIAEVFEEAGFPENVLQVVIGDHTVGESLVKSKVDGVSLTGSVKAGKRVGELALGNLKKVVLELGGSDPFIVLDDADLVEAAETATKSRLLNTGQSCIAAKRFIVQQQIAEDFAKEFVKATEEYSVIDDPMKRDTTIGPLVSKNQVESLSKQVKDANSKGATTLSGGREIEKQGYFFEPTILSNVSREMNVLNEEVFGPVAPIVVVKDETQAIHEANNTVFGLGASIWTDDYERASNLASKIQSGIVAINEMVKSDPRLPFGGIKQSGIGRELAEHGIREFVNVKTTVMKGFNNSGLFTE
jgi:acyl-CoA reductase-like NAD-dependent aldehyde dehydrogenase